MAQGGLMPRIRTVKPELFKHEELFDAEQETGFPLRVAFIGLFTACDREGRFQWKPRSLKSDILPFDNVDFSRVLDALETRGFIVKYQCEDEIFGCIPTWQRHQVINNRESPSRIPSLGNSIILTREARVVHAWSESLERVQVEGKGRDRKGREVEDVAERGKF